MGWWDDIVSGIGSAADKVKGWDVDWNKIGQGAVGLYDTFSAGDTRNDYADLLKQQEDQKYQSQLGNYNAYNDYLAKYYGAGSGGGGGGGRSGGGSRKAAIGAAKKGIGYLRPYMKAGKAVAPIHTQLYGQGANTANLLSAYLQRPEMMAKLSQPTDATSAGVDIAAYLPEWMKKGQ